MTSLLMSYPPISISHRLFPWRYSNSRDIVATSPSFSRPAPPPPASTRKSSPESWVAGYNYYARQGSIWNKFNKKKKKNTHTHTDTQRRAVSISNNFVVQVWTWNRLISNIAGTVTSTPVSKRMLCVSHLSYSCQGEKKLWSSKNVYYTLLQESISHMVIVVGKARENGRNIVGCYMLRPFAHPQCIDVVACCWELLRKVWNQSNL